MRRAQLWHVEFIISLVIVFAALTLFFQHNDRWQPEPHHLAGLNAEADRIAAQLMTQGVPEDWNLGTVNAIGLLGEGKRIDHDKLESLYAMDSGQRQVLLGARHRHHIQVITEDSPVNASNRTSVGTMPANARTVAASQRYAIHNGSVARLEVVVWR